MKNNRTRKNRYKYIVVLITLAIAGVICLSERITFEFSRKSGFYDKPFDLYIGKPVGTKVYYTLDGSDPTVDSMEYTEPIHIDDASNNPNVYAEITEVVPGYGTPKDPILSYVVPDEKIDKCNIVRAICVDKDGKVLEEKQASYFVGFDKKSGYDGLWICSVISDPKNFFNPKTGIMVCGENAVVTEDGSYRETNYLQRGMDWEREVYVQFFNPNHTNILNQRCGIRIHGKGSRKFVSKSYNLYAREEYDGNNVFRCDFWGDEYFPDKLMLFSGGEDGETLVRNKLVSDLTRGFAIESFQYIPCVMFIDGEYWGIRFITEKFDKEYFNHHYASEKDDVLIIKELIGSPEYALNEGHYDIEADSKKWQDFAVVISGRDEMGISQEYVENVFDYQSLLDYFGTLFYINRCADWPDRNMAYWSTRTYGEGRNDGKWRFLLYDVYRDSMNNPTDDTISLARDKIHLLDYELNNEKFRTDLKARFIELSETVFSDESVGNYLDEYSKLMREPIQKHYKRFYGEKYDGETFDEAIEELKTFFRERKDYLRNYSFE